MMAKDNINLNAASATATGHYRGTSMFIFNFRTQNFDGEPLSYNFTRDVSSSSYKVEALPKSYTSIPDLHMSSKSNYSAPLSNVIIPDFDFKIMDSALSEEKKFLDTFENNEYGWSSYHASFKRTSVENTDISTILPLIREKVHTLNTQYHCMEIISKTIQLLNPNQTPVDTCDQSVYALTKLIQWAFPDIFGNTKYFSIFGGLHIEKSLLIIQRIY